MTTPINSITQGVNSSQGLANSEQPNVPLPQPIAETTTQPLNERTIEVISAVPQAVEELICTPQEFVKLLDKNHQFPPKVIVKGNLILENFDIEALPTGLEVTGDMTLDNCQSLIALPQGLKVKGNLNIDMCFKLISFPEGLKIGGNLKFGYGINLTSWPEILEIGGDFNTGLSPCLTSWPQGLKVGRSVILNGCNLTPLPEGLVIYGNFSLRDCINLIGLPQRLKVRGNLELTDCIRLTSLRQDLEVGGDLILNGCTSLTSLPSWITTLGAHANGDVRTVDLENTGLSEDITERLRQASTHCMRFYFNFAATRPTIKLADMDKALAFWYKEAKDNTLASPNIVIDQGHLANVILFLARLTTTAEYHNLQTRQHLAYRVLEAFQQMSQNEDIKARACDLIHQGLISCDDRIISALEEIELMLLVHKIENTNHTAEELKKLGKSFLLLEMVNAKAKAHKETLIWIDEVEIYLAFQIGLADRFDLPVKTRNMFFRGSAQVTEAQLQVFGDEIEQACTDEKLEAFLQTWSPWIKFQKQIQVIPTYEKLAIAERELADDDTCVITLLAPEQPVLYNGRVYDYGAFIHQYLESGTDPVDRSKIDISQVKRIRR